MIQTRKDPREKALFSVSNSGTRNAVFGVAGGWCRKHERHYGGVTWDASKSATCPVCDAENEIALQSKALIYFTKRLEEERRPPPVLGRENES